jgi:hypothetical protein
MDIPLLGFPSNRENLNAHFMHSKRDHLNSTQGIKITGSVE